MIKTTNYGSTKNILSMTTKKTVGETSATLISPKNSKKEEIKENITSNEVSSSTPTKINKPENEFENDWVSLNVGGQIFTTTRSPLTMDKNSVLCKMFERDSLFKPGAKDNNGNFLIDRDPKYFSPLLNFLRTGKLILDNGISIDGIWQEAEYFSIQALIDLTHPQNRPDLTRAEIISHRKNVMFKGLNLMRVDFSRLSLKNEMFDTSNLKGAKFVHADLNEASFEEVEASYADFSHSKASKTEFTGSNLEHSLFVNSTLNNSNFSRANLQGSSFENAKCYAALFQRANLQGVDFSCSNLDSAKLHNADLRNVNFLNANLTNCRLPYADLRGAIVDWKSMCVAYEAIIRNAIVTKEQHEVIKNLLGLKIAAEFQVVDSADTILTPTQMGPH